MKIVSVIQESFMEYTNFISLVLFCFGCNMKCNYCYNYDFVTNSEKICNESTESIIDNNVTKLTDGLVFLGGEPTIYGKRLLEIAEYAKNKHYLSIKLFTNGTNPDLVLEGLNKDYFDFVSVDFKAYFSNNVIYYSKEWNEYVLGMHYFFDKVKEYNFLDKVEIRMTSVPELERDRLMVESICNKYGLTFLHQTDVRNSYKEIDILK